MKKLILSVVVTLFLTTAFAADKSLAAPTNLNETYKELAKMLNNYPTFTALDKDVVLVKVKITINENHEIVVMSTDTNDSDLNYYIKNTLNYRKLSSPELNAGHGLVFVVKFTK